MRGRIGGMSQPARPSKPTEIDRKLTAAFEQLDDRKLDHEWLVWLCRRIDELQQAKLSLRASVAHQFLH
jgi:hypothetical protein